MATDTVQKVKDKLSIVDVVTPYVKLTKAGKYFRGLSPFNKEKTPSFYVNPDRQSYYCFSSGQGGDMFTFIEKMEGLDFKGALKVLADKAGVEIVYEKGNVDRSKIDRLREIVTKAEALFIRLLDEKGPAYQYALKRGLTVTSIKNWGLGFAQDTWRNVLEALTAEGYTLKELESAGLIKEADGKQGTWYDRFRNRLMFPIRDSAGRTVGFTGRSLDPDDQAKYLNSPETELYKKSEVLFGMDQAKDAIRTRGFAILVEGQFDLVLLHQIGFTNTIALSGTALTPIHLSLIKRYADNLMLCLDADRAGLAASAKNATAALAAGMRVKAVRLPEGKDPADLATEDPKAFAKRVAESQSIVEFFLSVLSAAEKDSLRLVMAVEKTVLPLISAIQSPMEREHFVGIVAQAVGSTPEAVRAGLPKGSVSAPVAPQLVAAPKPAKQIPSAARAESLHAIVATYPETPLAKWVNSEYARINGESFPEAQPSERSLFEAGLTYGELPDEHAADDQIRAYERALLEEKLMEATIIVRQAESAGNEKEIAASLEEWKAISQRLSALS